MRFHAVIPTHGRRQILRRTLESLAAAERPPEFHKLTVIENGAADGSADVCAEFAPRLPIEYRYLPEAGKARACQSVFPELGNGFVLFLDDDIRIDPELLKHYAMAVRTNGSGHIYGGPVLVDYETPPEAWLVPFLPFSARGWPPPVRVPFPEQPFLGGNFGAFVEDIVSVGGMRAELGPGAFGGAIGDDPAGDEYDLQRRLYAAGCRPVFLPDAKAWHYVPAERCSRAWTLQRWYRNECGKRFTQQLSTPPRGLRRLCDPLYLFLLYPVAAISAWLAPAVPSPRLSFAMEATWQLVRGRLRGYRLARARSL